MSWNYRVARRRYEDGHQEIGIYSAYYDAKGNLDYLSVDPAPVNSYSLEELEALLELMKESLHKPVLDYDTGEDENQK